jgi:TPP-dependent pyruvate/acetoin dehydrogenase alpha subunit
MTPQPTTTATMQEFAAANHGFSLISNRKLLALYSAMVECRKITEQAHSQAKGRRAADSILGHEAAAVGAAIDLLPHDTVAPALWPDAALKAINPAPSIAPAFSPAIRKAANGSQQVALFFSSGKSAEQVAWLTAITQAINQNLPILFVFLNRAETSVAPAVGKAASMKRKGHALPVIHVDGNDVVAVYRVASESITHARKGHGPTLIDCRLSLPADPLKNMRNYLIGKGLDPAAFTD